MSEEKNMETTVTTENIDIDEVFGAGADSVVLPEEETKKPNILDRVDPEPDFTFTEPTKKEEWMDEEDVVIPEETVKKTEAGIKKEGGEILDDISDENEDVEEEVKAETRGRKPINGFTDVINKMVKSDKLFAFDDDKPLEEYSAKDIEELLEANLEERANQVRRETPKQFFEALKSADKLTG